MALDLSIACALGAGAWSLAWFVIGLAGGYVTSVALVALVCGLALAGIGIARGTPAPTAVDAGPPPGGSRRPAAIAAAVLVVIALVIAAVGALAPPTAKDTLQYHIALPKAFIEAGQLTVVGESIVAYSPLGAEMHGLWAMLLGRVVSPRVGEAAFGATMFAFLPLLLAFVHAWAAKSARREWALVAAALVATVPVVGDVAWSGSVDLTLALLLAVAVRAAARWWTSGAPRELATLALAAGFALGVKVLAIFPFVALALVALLGARRAPVPGPRAPAALSRSRCSPSPARRSSARRGTCARGR
jgi:MFS family permease